MKSFCPQNQVKTKKKVFTKNSPKLIQLSDADHSQIIEGDADADHSQNIGEDAVKLLGGYTPRVLAPLVLYVSWLVAMTRILHFAVEMEQYIAFQLLT